MGTAKQKPDELPEDPMDDWDCDEEDGDQEEYDYYYCYSCYYSCVTDHGGWGCPRCSAIMSGEYY